MGEFSFSLAFIYNHHSMEATLSPLGAAKKKSVRRFVVPILKALVSLLFAFILAVSAQVTYMYATYQPFFISGESMWPTLNFSSRYTGSDGSSTLIDPSTGDYRAPGEYLCDYGLMDSSEGFIERLERFDIVVSYSERPSVAEDGTIVPKSETLVIKRVMAFPGESFYFSTEPDELGAFYVKGVGESEYHLIEETFYDPSLHPNWTEADIERTEEAKTTGTVYRDAASREKYPYLSGTLEEGEYFLCGDNRAHSGDSRSKGPFSEAQLVGRAVAIIGKAKYVIPESGTPSYSVSLFDYRMPWDFEWLIS